MSNPPGPPDTLSYHERSTSPRATWLLMALLACLTVNCGGSSDLDVEGHPDATAEDGSERDGSLVEGDAPSCATGTTDKCYSGPPASENFGACKPGIRVCAPDGSGFGDCIGEVTPVPETCATAVDDDCDGQVNEDGVDCVCAPGEVAQCYSGPATTLGVGACKSGTQFCKPDGTGFGPCFDEVLPSAETCATTVDDDCDGLLNEEGAGCVCTPGAVESCYTGPTGTEGVGACHAGTRSCDAVGLSWGGCSGEVLPVAEACSTAVDDDCDGQVNESGADCVCTPGATTNCYSASLETLGKGACKAGVQTCNALGSGYGGCAGEFVPKAEDCGTFYDDDCDEIAECPGDAEWIAGVATPTLAVPSSVLVGQNEIPWGPYVLANMLGLGPQWLVFDATGKSTPFVLPEAVIVGAVSDSAGGAYRHVAGVAWKGPDFGAGPLPFVGEGLFVASYNDILGGTLMWAKGYPVTSALAPAISTVLGASYKDDCFVSAFFTGTLDLGLGPLSSSGSKAVLVARYDCKTGAVFFSRLLQGGGSGAIVELSGLEFRVQPIVAGRFTTAVDLGTGPLQSAGGSDIFVATLSMEGQTQAAIRFGGPGDDTLLFDQGYHSSLALAGTTQGGVDFGGGALAAGMYVASLNNAGGHLWSKSFPGCTPLAVAAADFGSVFVAADCSSGINFGNGLLPAGRVLVRFGTLNAGSDGAVAWSRPIPTTNFLKLGAPNATYLLLGGWSSAPVDFGMGAKATGPGLFVTEIKLL